MRKGVSPPPQERMNRRQILSRRLLVATLTGTPGSLPTGFVLRSSAIVPS